ncbi:Protein phosphatase 2C [Blastocystis hominis]|uniref:Protein phosphatase 2C n=1 Tax=Blastocystis hominis TaxID=12968 RepID=D8LYX7_BLAHO|nr:Protein phosphatase 2C [Blastocystis hominis]CBK21016.2 Protein phosphatase 2C [Blastocystis hominis]|eukprot:XP_012895064.1 Protein phosphatase 2C [Blastocystis hominis]
MNASSFFVKSRRALGTVSSLYRTGSIRIGTRGPAVAALNYPHNAKYFGTATNLLLPKEPVNYKHAVSYGALAASALFAVYGLTGGQKNFDNLKRGVGYDHYPSNNPCEDRIIVENPVPNILLTGVADGHGGTFVSDIVKMEFGKLVKKFFSNIDYIDKYSLESYMTQRVIQLYQALDDVVYDLMMSLWESDSSILTTGACLVSTIIYHDFCLVANAGDCRAVLGRLSPRGNKVEAVALTHDHNIREPAEFQKLKKAHPEERNLVTFINDEPRYVKGILQPTRCIGDFVLKVDLALLVHQRKEFIEAIPQLDRFARDFHPPYITATPEVTFFEIAQHDQFIVLASDGVWDELDNQAVVDIVAEVLRRGNSAEAAANTVIAACLKHAAGGGDGEA